MRRITVAAMRQFRLRSMLPFMQWRRPTGETARADAWAGLTVALLVIPQSLAYAQLAGVPAHHGLYAALLPALIGTLFGSSAILSTGPAAMTSLLTAASVGQLAAAGSAAFTGQVLLLALMAGLFQIAFGLARAGMLLNLLSHPVLMGFINAAAMVIMMSQLPALTGVPLPAGSGVLAGAWHIVTHLGAVHGPTLALSILGIAMLAGFRRWLPRWPGAVLTVLALTALAALTGFGDSGGQLVGAVPSGLPNFSVPPLDPGSITALAPAAFVIAVVSFMEAMSSSKVIAARTRTRWDENQELIGQGLAKAAAAFCNGLPVSASFSRSALNMASGARTGWSSVVCVSLVLAALLLLTPLLAWLPKPALAAMIVMAVWNLIDLQAMRHAWRAQRDDGLAAVLTFAVTLLAAPDIHTGVLAGIVFALSAFIYRRMLPRVRTEVDGAVGTVRFDAALFFANAAYFEDAVLDLMRENPALRVLLVPAQGINLLDATGAEMLRRLLPRLRDAGISFVVSGVKQPVRDVAQRSGVIELIGADHVFDTEAEARRFGNKVAGHAWNNEPEFSI